MRKEKENNGAGNVTAQRQAGGRRAQDEGADMRAGNDVRLSLHKKKTDSK